MVFAGKDQVNASRTRHWRSVGGYERKAYLGASSHGLVHELLALPEVVSHRCIGADLTDGGEHHAIQQSRSLQKEVKFIEVVCSRYKDGRR